MAREGKGSLRVNVQNLAECKHEEGVELGAGHVVPVAGVERVAYAADKRKMQATITHLFYFLDCFSYFLSPLFNIDLIKW